MNKYVKTIIVVFLVVIMIFLLLYFGVDSSISSLSSGIQVTSDSSVANNGKVEVGKQTPYFNLASLSKGQVSRTDIAGTPTVITFWATWSPESVDQIKILDDYLTNNPQDVKKQSNVRMITVDSQENIAVTENFMLRGGYGVEVLSDRTGETSNDYGIQTLPTTFFIDRNGIVEEIFVGTLSQKMLVDKMEKILR